MKTHINGNTIEQIMTNAVTLTQQQYDQLPSEQKLHGTYIISDSDSPGISASNVAYDSNRNVDDVLNKAVFGTVLYNVPGSTSQANIILDESVNNYSIIVIYYRSNDSYYGSVEFEPVVDGKSLTIMGAHSNVSSNTHYLKQANININDKTVAFNSNYCEIQITSAGITAVNAVNKFYITKIVGYK